MNRFPFTPEEDPMVRIARFDRLGARKIRYQLDDVPLWRPDVLPARGALGNCTIAMCWAFGLSILSPHPVHVAYNGGWLSSNGLLNDMASGKGLFVPLARPVAGCFGVFGWERNIAGHAWLVTKVDPGSGAVVEVIDCSPSNGREDSIRRHPPGARLKGSRVRYGNIR